LKTFFFYLKVTVFFLCGQITKLEINFLAASRLLINSSGSKSFSFFDKYTFFQRHLEQWPKSKAPSGRALAAELGSLSPEYTSNFFKKLLYVWNLLKKGPRLEAAVKKKCVVLCCVALRCVVLCCAVLCCVVLC